MKFSIISAAAILLASVASVNGDALGDAVKKFCGGLSVTNPNGGVFTPGTQVKVAVHNTPGEYQKYIQTLQLYQITKDGKLINLQNVWKGNQLLNTDGYLQTTLANNLSSGNYYYRLWVNNQVNGGRGPDCTPQSKVFKIAKPSHKNDDGTQVYHDDLDDENVYDKNHGAGCFGINFTQTKVKELSNSPTKGYEILFSIVPNSDGTETSTIQKIQLWKNVNGQESIVDDDILKNKPFNFTDEFLAQDHIQANQADSNAKYFYKAIGNNNEGDDKCTFQSSEFTLNPAQN